MGRCRGTELLAGGRFPASESNEDVQRAPVLKAQEQMVSTQLNAITDRIAELRGSGADTRALCGQAADHQSRKSFARTVAMIDRERCVYCGRCVDACRNQAISMNGAATIDSSQCTGCGLCVNECPSEAISLSETT